nr:reverse transcriptase domain-containing protein [Tanacetum cinerariifolium]
ARVYVRGNAGTNPDANTITGTFLLNNCYASVLFDTGADRSFVSTAFRSQFDIVPTVLDHDYSAEQADVQNSCQFHGLPGDDANKRLDKFLHVTKSIKVNGVTDDTLCLYLFPHSLTHHATAWFDHLPRNSINTFKQMAKMFLGKYFPPSMVTKLRNEITSFRQRPDESLFEAWERYKLSIDRCPNHNMLPVTQIDTFYNGLTLRHRDTINVAAATIGQTQYVYAAGAYNQGGNSYQPKGTLSSNTVTNPKEDLKGITNRSGTAYQGPTIPTTSSSSPPKVVERETEVKKDTMPPANNGSTKNVQPLLFPSSQGNKYLLFDVDYLSKWVEAKALPTNDARIVCKFLKSLFARFGTLHAIISDRGTHFCKDQFAKVMLKYSVTHRLTTAYHPQTNGQVEVSNCGLKRILERTVGENRVSWTSPRVPSNLDNRYMTVPQPFDLTIHNLYRYNFASFSRGSVSLIGAKIADLVSLSTITHMVAPTVLDHDYAVELADGRIVGVNTGHLATALGEIRAFQAREQARAGAPKGAGSSTNGDPPVLDLRTMEELGQPSLNGQGGLITSIAIQATNFELKNDMIQQVQNSCQFHGLTGDDANKHLDKFLHVTQSIKVNKVTDDLLRTVKLVVVLIPSLIVQPLLVKRITYMLREPTKGNNQGRNQFFQGSSHGQNPPSDYQAPGYQTPVHQPPIPKPQVVTTNEFTNFTKANDAILKNMQTNMTSLTNSNLELKNMFGQFMKTNTAASSGSGTLPGNTITNPKEELKGITTQSGTTYQGPTIPTPLLSLFKVVERETELVTSPVSAPKPSQKPLIPYPSRLHDQKLRDKANDYKEKIFKIFQDLNFNISFVNALILMPKFGLTIKTLITNKDKLYELARTLLNEHYLAVLLKKLLEKLGDPGKFFIPCDFPGMAKCLALADLGVSINLMPLSVWNKLSLPQLSPKCMTLKLVDRSISRPIGVVEDVFVKVGTFHFSANFVVIDFDADP